jgi:hypothetical protein
MTGVVVERAALGGVRSGVGAHLTSLRGCASMRPAADRRTVCQEPKNAAAREWEKSKSSSDLDAPKYVPCYEHFVYVVVMLLFNSRP